MDFLELTSSKKPSITRDSVSVKYEFAACIEDDYVDAATDMQVLIDGVYAFFPAVDSIDVDGVTVPLVLSDVRAEHLSTYQWKLWLDYTLPENESSDPNYLQISLSTSGGSTKITQSKEVKFAVANTALGGGAAPNLGGAIGYTKNGIEGTDVLIRGLTFSLTAYMSPSVWNLSYINTLYALSTTYNNASFKGFAAGEVLFVNGDASGSLYNVVPVTFNFIAAPNQSGVPDPGFPNLTANGHDVIDYLYTESVDSATNQLIMLPTFRYVHRVYDPGNFSLLGIGT